MPDVNVTQVITALLTGGSVSAIYQYLKDRKKEPIDKQAAAIAVSESNVALATQMRDLMKQDRDEKEARLQAVEMEVRSLKRLFDISIYHLIALWRWITENNLEGAPPLPAELASIVNLPEESFNHGRSPHPEPGTHSV